MIHNISILDEIKKGGYEASLITTFNAYLSFYEEVVLRKLQSVGVRYNVLMMDARQCTSAIHTDPPRLAGYHYPLIPMSSPGAFHSKVIFLVGKQKGLLFVGSHNMTLAGFGFNRELSNVIHLNDPGDKETIAMFVSAWTQIQGWIQEQQFPQELLDMISKVTSFAPWLKSKNAKQPNDTFIISSQPGAANLWEQLLHVIQRPVTRVIVLGAFFDSQLRLLKRLQQDLSPQECIVGIDPETVQAPDSLQAQEGLRVVKIEEHLGKIENRKSGYLHAKCLIIQTEDGNTYLVSGSANPTSSAWLTNGLSGNTEMILVRQGQEAETTAKDLKLLDIPAMKALQKSEWNTVKKHWQAAGTPTETEVSRASGMALIVDEGIKIVLELPEELQRYQFHVMDQGQQCLATHTLSPDVDMILPLSGKLKENARFVFCELDGTQCASLLVYHPRRIQELLRSDAQRQFREALVSLDSESPRVDTLITYIEKIIFSKVKEHDSEIANVKSQPRIPPKTVEETPTDEEGSFAIDINETRKSQRKHHLHYSGELGYILDTFIYHLKLDTESRHSLEQQDNKGRTEEEQIGVEDEDERTQDGLDEQERAEKTLLFCHSKVKRLVKRMNTQLDAFKKGNVSLENIVVRLAGVLAVLHHLRGCDGHVAWIAPGQTTVPLEERQRLLRAGIATLCEGKQAPLFSKEPDETLINSEEFARLRGLLLWLAWDCGISLKLRKPYREMQPEFRQRLSQNSLLLPLIQLIQDDEVVIEEARYRISALSSGELDWLERVLNISQRIQQFKPGSAELLPGSQAKTGDIATNIKIPHFGFRFVVSCREKKVYFGQKEKHIYSTVVIKVLPIEKLMRF